MIHRPGAHGCKQQVFFGTKICFSPCPSSSSKTSSTPSETQQHPLRIARQWDAPMSPTSAATDQLKTLLGLTPYENPLTTPQPQPATTIWVDASLQYIGSIIQEKNGDDRVTKSIRIPRVASHLSIFELEIGAALMGAQLHGPGHATLATDNLATFFALTKGHSFGASPTTHHSPGSGNARGLGTYRQTAG